MFKGIVGQDHIKERLEVLIQYGNMSKTRLPDLFFAGPGGTGKSTLARIVGKNYGEGAFAELNSTSIKNMDELLSFLYINCGIKMTKSLNDTKTIILPKMVIFIDEAHEIKEPLATQLLNAMDAERVTTFATKKKEVYRADFKNVTFIMATTNKNDLTNAFLSRFQIFELASYKPMEIALSVHYRTGWSKEACFEVGKRAKSVMRTAVLDIDNIRAFLTVKNLEPTGQNVAEYYKRLKKVDSMGLDVVDYSILEILNKSEIPLGIKNIGNRLNRPENEIGGAIGFLASQGLIEKVGGGQTLTIEGRTYLNANLVNVG